jgi:hypothetical protein
MTSSSLPQVAYLWSQGVSVYARRALTLTGKSGNYYFIQNISERDVKLFFAQGRQVEAEEVDATSSQFNSEAPETSPTKRRHSEPYEEIGYDDRTAGGNRPSARGQSSSVAQPRQHESSSPRKRGQSQPVLPARRR